MVAGGRPAHRGLVVALLFLGMLINYIDRGNLSIAAVPMMAELGLSAAAMGALLSAFFWSYAALQLPAGFLVDRFGLKWTYAAAFLLWSLASAGVGLARSPAEIFLLRLLLGVGEAIAPAASLAYIKRHFREEEQGLPTGIYVSGMMAGPAIGAMLGAALLERFGWRPLFVLTGLASCIWIVPWLAAAPSASPAPAAAPGPAPRRPFPWAAVLRSPVTWGLTVGAFFYSYFWYFCITWLPSYLLLAHSFSFLKMGSYMAGPLAGMGIMSVVCGRLADRAIRRTARPLLVRKLFVSAGCVLASLVGLVTFFHSSGEVLAILLIALTGLGLAAGNYWALTQVITPAALIGRVIGYQNTIAQLGGVCAPILTGLLLGPAKDFRASVLIAALSPLIAIAAINLTMGERNVARLREEL
jgi:ACS family D-galactonate transporter-like MFS transporter